jgi:hypothetical protein
MRPQGYDHLYSGVEVPLAERQLLRHRSEVGPAGAVLHQTRAGQMHCVYMSHDECCFKLIQSHSGGPSKLSTKKEANLALCSIN